MLPPGKVGVALERKAEISTPRPGLLTLNCFSPTTRIRLRRFLPLLRAKDSVRGGEGEAAHIVGFVPGFPFWHGRKRIETTAACKARLPLNGTKRSRCGRRRAVPMFLPGENQITSPGRISSTGPSSRCAQPQRFIYSQVIRTGHALRLVCDTAALQALSKATVLINPL